jgi:hypothetical protein
MTKDKEVKAHRVESRSELRIPTLDLGARSAKLRKAEDAARSASLEERLSRYLGIMNL